MAGKDVYLGKMLESLQADMLSMSNDMSLMVGELINLKNTVSAGIAVLNVGVGTDYVIELGPISKSFIVNKDRTIVNAFTLSCFGKGVVRVHIAGCSHPFRRQFMCSYDGTNWVDLFVSYSGGGPLTFDLSVDGSVVFIGIKDLDGMTGGVDFSGAFTVSYNIVDVVNNGAFSLV